MIPKNENFEEELEDDGELDFTLETEPSLTYAMKVNADETKDSIFVGKVDDIEAARQAALKILNAIKVNADETKDSIFVGKVDDIEAVRQAVLKILNTERYENEIYSWDYGIELQDLFGMSMEYAMSEIKLRIEDALLADDRIASVDGFRVERTGKRTIHCSFTVTTVQGEEIREETEIDI